MSREVNNNDVMVKITKLEIDTSYIKKNIDEIKVLLATMPETYALKSEVREVKDNLKNFKDSSRNWIKYAITSSISTVSTAIMFFTIFK